MKDFISINDFSRDEIMEVLNKASEIEKNGYSNKANKIIGSIFFEPSTRTRLSFCSATYRMGFDTLGFDSAEGTSIQKGESLRDTIKMLDLYSDLIVIRHNIEGAARFASEIADVPVINAGDGSNEHPSQTMLDLYTIWKQFGKLDNLKVALVGDLKYGRTVHSLVKALKLFNAEFYFVAPKVTQIPTQIIEELARNKISYHILDNYNEIIDKVDVLYMTRIQRERFDDIKEYESVSGIYKINKASIVGKCKDSMIILHPLPRVDEINIDLDDTKHALYFQQANNGIVVRMAMMELGMDSKTVNKQFNDLKPSEKVLCKNPKCICNKEPTSNKTFSENNNRYCYYCGTVLKD